LRLLRQAKEWQEQDGAGMFAYIVPASQYPAITGCKRILGEGNFVPYRAYWALKLLKKT
jgi:hypothetical protein